MRARDTIINGLFGLVFAVLVIGIFAWVLALPAQTNSPQFYVQWVGAAGEGQHHVIGYGTKPRDYDVEVAPTGTATAFTITGLDCVLYYVSVKVCNDGTTVCDPWGDEAHGVPYVSGKRCAGPLPSKVTLRSPPSAGG